MTRNNLDRFFPGVRHPILPVIHTDSQGLNLRQNINKAGLAGADGVWLICHDPNSQWNLAAQVEQIAQTYNAFWIGVNFLGWDNDRAIRIAREAGAKGVWVDDAQIDERVDEDSQAEALAAYNELDSDFLYFGGVAFKYQREVQDLEKAAYLASCFMDVVTTSGPGTGKASDVSKVQRMRDGMGEAVPFALASGLTVDNVESYLPYVDVLMVATGVSETWDRLDLEKMKAFVDKVREYTPGV